MVLCGIFTFYHTIWFNLVIAAAVLLSVDEIRRAFAPEKPFAVFAGMVPLTLYTTLIPFFASNGRYLWLIFTATVFYYAALVVLSFPKLSVAKLGGVLSFWGLILLGFYTPIYLKALFSATQCGYDALFYVIFALGVAWGGDIFAYFIGSAFGKHKMAPQLSPHKSVEGAVGGVAGSILISLLALFAYSRLLPWLEPQSTATVSALSYFVAGALAAATSLVGMIGDLFASAVKRQCGIKDYGTLFPGHGGMLDRFDSALLTLPVVAAVVAFLPLITR